MPSEGDKPRQVDNDAEPVLSHNKYALNEPYPASEMNATPENPGMGGHDEEQIMQLTQAETARPAVGPDTLSGGSMSQPIAPVPDGIHDPTSEGGGTFGAAQEFSSRDLKKQEE